MIIILGGIPRAGDVQRRQLLDKRCGATILNGEPTGNADGGGDDDDAVQNDDEEGVVDNDDDDEYFQPGRNYSIGVRAVSNNIESVSNTAFQATSIKPSKSSSS